MSHVLDGFPELDVHPDEPAGLRALAAGGLRGLTLTNRRRAGTDALDQDGRQ